MPTEAEREYFHDYYLKHEGANRQRVIPGAEREIKLCKRCNQTKLRGEFTIRKTGARVGHLSSYCKKCCAEINRRRWVTHTDDMRDISWRSKIKKAYGLSEDEYYRMLRQQNDSCAICLSQKSWSKNYKYKKNGSSRFMVDHCHTTRKVRGLLCTRCNRALGLLGDNIENLTRAAEYLKFSRQ